jgi:hypothetical protein
MSKPKPTPIATPDIKGEIPVKRKKGLSVIVIPIVFIAGIIILKLSFVFFFIGMLPSIVAYMIDRGKYKYIFSIVAALNFAGVFPYVMDIGMHSGGSFEAVNNKLSDAFVWLSMFGSAAIGWSLVHISPTIASVVLKGIYQARIMQLEKFQHKLIEEWGEEIKKGTN